MCGDMANLQTMQDEISLSLDPDQAKLKKFSKVDCSSKLSNAKKTIKVI